MIGSLRGRLFIGLSAMIIGAGATGAIFTYTWAFDEAIEIQDSALIEIASLARSGGLGVSPPIPDIEENAQVRLIELQTPPRHPSDEQRLSELKDGLHTVSLNGQPNRVLLGTRGDGTRYAAAQPTAVRDDTADDVAIRTLLPTIALIPCLLLVAALVIGRSLRPMKRLAGQLDARAAEDLTPLSTAGTPTELHPFIISINGLLARTGLLIDQQQRFIADAAHELRTPITALSLQTENLESIALPEQARERVTALKQGMHRTKRLLEQLLAHARQEVIPAGPAELPMTELDRAAKEIVADLLPAANDRDIDLGFVLIEHLSVRGEPVLLAAVIRNLLDNALRATPRGGKVDISIRREGDAAVLQIDDTGPGVAASDMDRIMEPFYRGSRPEGEGAGLGLSIVKRIVERLGGEIQLANIAEQERTGLRATVRLPLPANSRT